MDITIKYFTVLSNFTHNNNNDNKNVLLRNFTSSRMIQG